MRSRNPAPWLALLCWAVTAPAFAQVVPNDGWVTDRADLLTPQQERSLEALMESFRLGSGHEIALLTVPDLGGRSLENYALDVAREWGLGQQERHNGALLLVARDERKLRIEVGRGLEGNLTDLICGRIIRNVITPEFKQGRFYDGLRGGIEAMHAAAGGDYAQIPDHGRRSRGKSGIGLLPLAFFIWLVITLLAHGGGGPRGRGGGGMLPWLLAAWLSSGGGRSSGWGGGGRSGGGGGFGGFGGGGGFSGGGASGGW